MKKIIIFLFIGLQQSRGMNNQDKTINLQFNQPNSTPSFDDLNLSAYGKSTLPQSILNKERQIDNNLITGLFQAIQLLQSSSPLLDQKHRDILGIVMQFIRRIGSEQSIDTTELATYFTSQPQAEYDGGKNNKHSKLYYGAALMGMGMVAFIAGIIVHPYLFR